jgi:hypothetical protein
LESSHRQYCISLLANTLHCMQPVAFIHRQQQANTQLLDSAAWQNNSHCTHDQLPLRYRGPGSKEQRVDISPSRYVTTCANVLACSLVQLCNGGAVQCTRKSLPPEPPLQCKYAVTLSWLFISATSCVGLDCETVAPVIGASSLHRRGTRSTGVHDRRGGLFGGQPAEVVDLQPRRAQHALFRRRHQRHTHVLQHLAHNVAVMGQLWHQRR